MLARIETDGLHLRRIGFPIRQNVFFYGAIDDAPDHIAVFLVHGDQFALQNQRKFRDHRRIHKRTFLGGKAALRNFVRLLVAADKPKIITGVYRVGSAKGDSEDVSMQMVIWSSSVMPPQAAFIMFGVPSSLYVPIIRTGIGNIQFLTPKFFFMVISLLFAV